MNGDPPRTGGVATWIAVEPDPVLAFLHTPERADVSSTAVLFCPPFGWEEMSSYRRRRRWAEALARSGFATARIDLPGTGDSGGSPADPGRLDAWTHAVGCAAGWLRETTGAARIASISIGLGGMLACRAVAQGALIDDLVLWAVPAQGRILLREMRAYAGVVSARYSEDARPGSQEDGDLELTGFLMSAETAQALGDLRLTDLEIPDAERRRILLLGRDGLAVDQRLREHFEQAGALVTVDPAGEYGSLVADPQDGCVPEQTFERTISWLAAMQPRPLPSDGANKGESTAASIVRGSTQLAFEATTLVETPLQLDGERGEIFGILTENAGSPSAAICAVLLNGGPLRHVGPNRTWVEIARRWAARGVPTIRVDLEGIGESAGDERELLRNRALYAPERTDSTLAILDQLAARGLPNRFLLGGLCSGAYWSLHAALADTRVAGALMINLYAFVWSEALVAERETLGSLHALQGNAWRRLLRRDLKRAQLKTAIGSIRPARIRAGAGHPVERAHREQLEGALSQLRDQGTEALLLLSRGELLHDQLVRQRVLARIEQWPNLKVEQIPSRDHLFRALWLQRHVHGSADRMLERVLERTVAVQHAQPQ
jgi:alpha/beta superfamily hydrolase